MFVASCTSVALCYITYACHVMYPCYVCYAMLCQGMLLCCLYCGLLCYVCCADFIMVCHVWMSRQVMSFDACYECRAMYGSTGHLISIHHNTGISARDRMHAQRVHVHACMAHIQGATYKEHTCTVCLLAMQDRYACIICMHSIRAMHS